MPDQKVLGPAAGYIEMLDHFTNDRLKEAAEKPSSYNPLRPSSAGKCTRELGYELMEFRGKAKYPRELKNPATDRLLKLGHSIEYHLLRQFEDAFRRADKDIRIKYKQQVLSFFKLPNGDRIEGSIDATFISPRWGVVIDVKSKKDKFSRAFKTHWEETAEKLAENEFVSKFGAECFYVENLKGFLANLRDPFWAMNFYQLNFYFFDEHSFLRNRGVDHAALIYYCKNDSRVREIRFKPCEDTYNQTKDKFIKVSNLVDADKVEELEKDFTLGSIKCAFCPFSKKCWGSKDSLQAYFDTFPNKRWPKKTSSFRSKESLQLETHYDILKKADKTARDRDEAEKAIIKIMDEGKIKKIRFEDGSIYELKSFKTGGVGGGPRMALRKGKL